MSEGPARRRSRRVVAPATNPVAEERAVREERAPRPGRAASATGRSVRVVTDRAPGPEDRQWLEDRPPHWG